MSRIGNLTAVFAGDERAFHLKWREIIELQESRNVGPWELLTRVVGGLWHVQDIREILRLGLQGGGMAPAEAVKLVKSYVEGHPEEMMGGDEALVKLAARVLATAIDGTPDEPLGESLAPIQQNGSTTFPTERSESGQFTQSAH